MVRTSPDKTALCDVEMPVGPVTLRGTLGVPHGACGVVLFAHGSGSSRFSPRNRHVAEVLREAGVATLLMDLLTEPEEAEDLRTRRLRFDIELLSRRVVGAAEWLSRDDRTAALPVGYFGASTGAAAALVAASRRPGSVAAVVSRGGRPDLAGAALDAAEAPTLLIVGGLDTAVIDLNRQAMQRLGRRAELVIVSGATHLFEEPGTLDEAARLTANWFRRHFSG